ncbi:fungal-specific transcription factor domain-containing protein, partial [Phyllosticta capitalensis]|uniref:fungal-specific transcription factor domain-containing protein n=1 Tax=Phyllosticta capitalensis TaxID=121624 RepID=UPI00312F45A2
NGVTKRKQSKSRNGCSTCKAKRLKCDETKPTCQQCARRSVPCGGYKKDFKWRPFEEASFTGPKPPQPAKQSKAPTVTAANPQSPPVADVSPQTSLPSDVRFAPPFASSQQSAAPVQQSMLEFSFPTPGAFPPGSSPIAARPEPAAIDPLEPGSTTSTTSMFNDADTVDTVPSVNTAISSLSSGQSPRLVDLLLPGTDPNAPPHEYMPWEAQFPGADAMFPHPPYFGHGPNVMEDDGDIEEIMRPLASHGINPDHEAWVMRLPTPLPSGDFGRTTPRPPEPFPAFLHEPRVAMDSPEMTAMLFDRQTCGILSLKNGPSENPWRSLIWPLAQDSPALFHAIASMTNFHMSKQNSRLRVLGIEHMRSSIEHLATGIGSMHLDAAIATTLALAFAETWDQQTSTGIDHIKGAKILVQQALARHQRAPSQGDNLARFKFLCNTWVYMDVTARLTSMDDDESNDFDAIASLFAGPFEFEAQLDPLMGCASTLFPIIGHVANLVRRVRRSESNSPSIISQAMELKTQLEDWVPQAYFEVPEDPTSHIQHSLQTAEAYRWATLLYLHQAVPEIPSLSSAELAKKVLIYLATVPLTSRAVIVHIYPLTAAGSEATGEDRQWVQDRWESMSTRMVIGIVDRCLDICKEVWARRDAYEARVRPRMTVATKSSNIKGSISPRNDMLDEPLRWNENFPRASATDAGSGLEDREYTVRGRLHWLGVMKDWGWE